VPASDVVLACDWVRFLGDIVKYIAGLFQETFFAIKQVIQIPTPFKHPLFTVRKRGIAQIVAMMGSSDFRCEPSPGFGKRPLTI
jgi:hypothetical protein